jgi:isopenicillin-N epimerase
MGFEQFFAKDPDIYFLNAGTQSRAPTEVLQWMRAKRDKSELNPTRAMVESFPALWEAQKQMAEFLGAAPGDIFLRANITSAFNDFLFALPLPQGSEILVPDLEYGAISELAKWRTRETGLSFRRFELFPQSLKGDSEIVAACVAALRPETKVFIVSHVATATGTVLPIAAIAAELRKRGIYTLVDGAHAVGALPLDLSQLSDLDFYGGNFHKWFMGPAGTGFGWVHPRWKNKLDWKFGGWSSFGCHSSYGSFGDGDPETCRRLIPGTIDPIPFLALPEVLKFWRMHGPEKIRAQQNVWRDLVGELAEDFGWERTCPQAGLAALISFARPARWGSEAPAALATRIYRECRVQLANTVVGDKQLVRLSPGVYATEEEVKQGMKALQAFKA